MNSGAFPSVESPQVMGKPAREDLRLLFALALRFCFSARLVAAEHRRGRRTRNRKSEPDCKEGQRFPLWTRSPLLGSSERCRVRDRASSAPLWPASYRACSLQARSEGTRRAADWSAMVLVTSCRNKSHPPRPGKAGGIGLVLVRRVFSIRSPTQQTRKTAQSQQPDNSCENTCCPVC